MHFPSTIKLLSLLLPSLSKNGNYFCCGYHFLRFLVSWSSSPSSSASSSSSSSGSCCNFFCFFLLMRVLQFQCSFFFFMQLAIFSHVCENLQLRLTVCVCVVVCVVVCVLAIWSCKKGRFIGSPPPLPRPVCTFGRNFRFILSKFVALFPVSSANKSFASSLLLSPSPFFIRQHFFHSSCFLFFCLIHFFLSTISRSCWKRAEMQKCRNAAVETDT